MIKIENVEVVGWEHAIRGMRNPKNSWDKSDSIYFEKSELPSWEPVVDIGPNDHKLMMNLSKAGADHRKYIRYLEVYLDITAPFYWWKEFKTYRHGRKFMDDDDIFEWDDDMLEYHIETNSCSTMHKIHEKEFELDDFSHEHLINVYNNDPMDALFIGNTRWDPNDVMDIQIKVMNYYRQRFLETKDKNYWWQMIQLLPSSYNQKRTVKLSYEVLARMYHSRKNHKLDEWREFCKWIESLPYSEIVTGSRDA